MGSNMQCREIQAAMPANESDHEEFAEDSEMEREERNTKKARTDAQASGMEPPESKLASEDAGDSKPLGQTLASMAPMKTVHKKPATYKKSAMRNVADSSVAPPVEARQSSVATLEPGPSNLEECMQWCKWYLLVLFRSFGGDQIKKKLRDTKWVVATIFSGMLCPEIAVMMIQAALMDYDSNSRFCLPDVTWSFGLDKDPHCRAALKANCPGRCCFGEIQEWLSETNGPTTELKSEAYCYACDKIHTNLVEACTAKPDDDAKLADHQKVCVTGPPCTPEQTRRTQRKSGQERIPPGYHGHAYHQGGVRDHHI